MVVKMNGTEQDFVHRINVKEEAAFHDLFTRFRNYLVLFAMRRIDQLDAAEDIVQETFITVWENKKIYNSYQGLKAYLYELVQNKCTNYLKHKQVEDRYVSYVKTTGEETEGDYNLMQEEIYRELYMAVRELPEKCQRVFELHLEGKKNDEIAEILGIRKSHHIRHIIYPVSDIQKQFLGSVNPIRRNIIRQILIGVSFKQFAQIIGRDIQFIRHIL